MQYAQVVIIEAGGKEVKISLRNMLSTKELYDIFHKLTGLRCMITLYAGVAHVNCDFRQKRKDDHEA